MKMLLNQSRFILLFTPYKELNMKESVELSIFMSLFMFYYEPFLRAAWFVVLDKHRSENLFLKT